MISTRPQDWINDTYVKKGGKEWIDGSRKPVEAMVSYELRKKPVALA